MKIFIGTFVSLILLAYFLFTIFHSYSELQKSLTLRAESNAKLRAKSLSVPLWNLDTELVKEMLDALNSDPDFLSAVVYNEKGVEYAKVGLDKLPSDNDITAEENIYFLHDGENINVGKIRLRLTKNSINIQFRNSLITGLTLYCILICLLMYAISRSLKMVTEPLTAISKGMKLYSNGEKNIDLPIFNSQDEIGILSNAFNQMVTELNDLHRGLEEKVKLRTEELSFAMKQADSANNLKSAFLANMSHELRTPMNGVLGMIQGTLNTPLSLEQREYLEIAKTSGNSLLNIINEILDISKIESGKLDIVPTRTKLSDIIVEVLNSTSLKAYEKGLEVLINFASDLPKFVYVDAPHLRQVLTNLLGNAIKFTEKGEITLKIEASDIDVDNKLYRIQVSDSGIGITPEGVEKIFDSFVQADQSTSKKYGGTGLGLSISKQLIELMGGKIWAESILNKGTTFFIELPLKIDKETLYSNQNQKFNSDIILVDSNSVLTAHIQNLLESHVNNILVVNSISEAALKSKKANDFNKESVVVFSVTQNILEDHRLITDITAPSIKSIALLPFHELTKASLLIERGVSVVLPKPFLAYKLIESISKALNSNNLSNKPTLIFSREATQQPNTHIKTNKSLKILVADDTKINRTVIKVMLQQMGHKVTLAESGRESIAILENAGHFSLENHEAPFDIIVMDVQMPELDGTEATAIIRQREQEVNSTAIPILACTAHALKGDKEKFLAAGMDDYLTKPIEPTKLRDLLERFTRE